MDEVELYTHRKKLFTCRLHNTFLSRLRGLMFASQLKIGEGVLLSFPSEQQIDLHMLFVFFPLDLVWINGSGRIVQIERHVQPFMWHVRGTRAQSVLEVKAGATRDLRVGDLLTIKLTREN